MVDLHRRLAAALGLCVALAGCSFESDYGGTRFQCKDDRGCPLGTTCSDEGFCEAGDRGDAGAGGVDASLPVAPPSFVQEAETTWTYVGNGGSKQTSEFDVQAGDVLIAYAISENSETIVAAINGGGLTWTPRETIHETSRSWLGVWSATATEDRAITVSFTLEPDSDGMFGANVVTFRGSTGVGQSESGSGSGTPTVELVTTRDLSAVVIAIGDWNAQDGQDRAWLDDAGSFEELSYFRAAANYTSYGGLHLDVGDSRLVTVGLLGPANQDYSVAAVEVLGGGAD